MERLQDRPYRSLKGGVSLGSQRVIRQASRLADDVPLPLRRSFLQYGADDFSRGAIRSADNVTFNFADDGASLTAATKPGTPLRGLFGDAITSPFERTITGQGQRLTFSTRSGETAIGQLEVAGGHNGFSVGWRGLDMDAGYALADQMASSRAPEATLFQNPAVQSVVRLGDDGSYLVKLKGSDGWMKLALDSAPGERIAGGFQARVGTPSAENPTFNLAWIDEGDFAGVFNRQGYLVYKLDEGVGTMPVGSVSARGPPSTAVSIELSRRSVTVRGHFDIATGELYVTMGDGAGPVSASLRTYDMSAIGLQARRWGKVRYNLATEQGYVSGLADDFAEGPATTAQRISSDPKGFSARLSQDLVKGLEATDSFLASGDDMAALASLQCLEKIHGPLPDIRLRQGLTEIGLGRPGNTTALVRGIDEAALHNPGSFFKEINRRLELPGLSEAEA